ncbi:multicopper oxidase family protein [Raineyella sp. LH-20]|uniref:multicopper oxidase family protein n=1 Tax=Raineyella sp. LH-20 TaxID=3081204 RepID=UPI0029542E5C|nr:multicopper oxidase domain-containing protein [Raineyella sp. LH-20]WOP17375.1 multicopper oxidase domain-containing protein [Raineyella sp. LH-20]
MEGPGAYAALTVTQPLAGNKIPQFIDPVPSLTLVDGTQDVSLSMSEFTWQMLPTGFAGANGLYASTGTYVWGYRPSGATSIVAPGSGSYLGPVVLTQRGTPTQVSFTNNLPRSQTAQGVGWHNWTDQTLHWADPLTQGPSANHYTGPVPAVTHLHGGEVPPWLDGGPDAWFTSDGHHQGPAAYGVDATGTHCVYRYPNAQEAASIWFHDHALGATRLNVYAGIAGAYLLRDRDTDALGNPLPDWLPPGLAPYGIGTGSPLTGAQATIPLVIQDRMFDVNGQLFFPNVGMNPALHPYWMPEFVGDTITVNGKVWPYKAVDGKRHRFLFLNGSNARTYDLSLVDSASGVRGPRMWVIGTDGGYLDRPALIDPNSTNKAVPKSLLIMPGERYDVIIDFNDATWRQLLAAKGVTFPLNTLQLRNTAPVPYPDGGATPTSTTGRVMQFRVSAQVPTDTGYDPAGGGSLRPRSAIVRLVDPVTGTPATGVTPAVTRQLTLNEVAGPKGPFEALVNNTKWTGLSVAVDKFPDGPDGGLRTDFPAGDPLLHLQVSEAPKEGTTELWEIINLTADAHPIHLHLVQFQLMNRQVLNAKAYLAAYSLLFPGSTAIDPATGLPYPPGVFIGGYGPPADYVTGQGNVYDPKTKTSTPTKVTVGSTLGGNPDVGPYLVGAAVPPQSYEAGWKDTVMTRPGQVTRFIVRWSPNSAPVGSTGAAAAFPFDPSGNEGYVWHCHIIDHEDNEMMRPDKVVPLNVTRSYIKGTDF